MYALTQGEAEAGTSNVMTGQISIAHTSTYTLINSRASHSFLFAYFIKKLDMVLELLNDVCNVSLPSGENLLSQFSFKVIPVKINGRELLVNLIVLGMINYDVILGMDRLSKHNATIFCKKKKVVFQLSEEQTFEYKGTLRKSK